MLPAFAMLRVDSGSTLCRRVTSVFSSLSLEPFGPRVVTDYSAGHHSAFRSALGQDVFCHAQRLGA